MSAACSPPRSHRDRRLLCASQSREAAARCSISAPKRSPRLTAKQRPEQGGSVGLVRAGQGAAANSTSVYPIGRRRSEGLVRLVSFLGTFPLTNKSRGSGEKGSLVREEWT